MRLFIFSLVIFVLGNTVSNTVNSQNISEQKNNTVRLDSIKIIDSINIIINNDSLTNEQKLDLLNYLLKTNNHFDLDSIGFGLTNEPEKLQFFNEDYFQQNDSLEKNKNVNRKQCEAITRKGTRCSRNAKAGSKFCWQHDK